MEPNQMQSKTLKWALIVGIVIVLNMFFNYTLSLVYKQPDFNAYCPASQVITTINNQNECVTNGGQWNGNVAKISGDVAVQPNGYCDLQFTCRQSYESDVKNYDRNVFLTLVVLGVLMFVIGNFLKTNYVVSTGLVLAGVLSFIIASVRYWTSANDLIHVIILAVALLFLFWIALKKFKN